MSPGQPRRYSKNQSLRAHDLQGLYGRGTGPVAFLDEAYRKPLKPGEAPFYLMTAVLIERQDLGSIRQSILPFGGVNSHYHTTELFKQDPEQIGAFLRHVNELPVDSIITVQTLMRNGDFEQARDDCLTRMAFELNKGGEPVQHLIMESLNQISDPGRNHKDREVIGRAVRGGLFDREVSIHHASPTHEKLLWIPDVVSWAERRQLALGDTRWMENIETVRIVHAAGLDLTAELGNSSALKRRSPLLPQQNPGAQSLDGSSEKIGTGRVSSSVSLPRAGEQRNVFDTEPSVTVNAASKLLRDYKPTAEDRIVDGFGKGNEVPIVNGVYQYANEQGVEGSRPNKRMESLINRINDSKAFSEVSSSVMEGLLERLQGQRKAVEAQADSTVKPVREDPPRPESPGLTIQ